MGGSSRIALFVGLVVVLVAGYVGYVHTVAAGATEVPGSVAEMLGRIFPAKKKEEVVQKVMDVKDSSALHQTIKNLQVPCGYIIATSLYEKDPSALNTATVTPLDTIIDPGLGQSTIAKDRVLADRYLKILYEEAADPAYIPAKALWLRMGSLEATLPSSKFLVVDDDGSMYKLRLGRDFLQANQAKLDLDEMELYLSIGENPKVMVPFLKTRSAPDLTDSVSNDEL